MKKPKPLVVDTSVIVKWLNQKDEPYLNQADKIFEDASKQKIEILAPELAKYEAGNALLYKGMTLPESKQSLATSAILANFSTSNLVGGDGIEPSTFALSEQRSTTELATHLAPATHRSDSDPSNGSSRFDLPF